jgi:hypothetical protein
LTPTYVEAQLAGDRNLVIGTFVYPTLLVMPVPDTSGRAVAAPGTEQLRHVAAIRATARAP